MCGLKPTENTYVIKNRVNIKEFDHDCNRSLLRRHGIDLSTGKTNILFIGRFVYQRGFDLITRALVEIDSFSLDKICIYAFCKGELKCILNNPIYHLLPRYVFSPVSEINLLYPCFDYLLLSSHFDGLPLVVLEAMSSGVPAIVSDAPGLSQAFPPGWPLIFKKEDTSALRQLLWIS
jgi:glycosyltransferase involved in cell wall biosynthesis